MNFTTLLFSFLEEESTPTILGIISPPFQHKPYHQNEGQEEISDLHYGVRLFSQLCGKNNAGSRLATGVTAPVLPT
jgi:hypothetical protein